MADARRVEGVLRRNVFRQVRCSAHGLRGAGSQRTAAHALRGVAHVSGRFYPPAASVRESSCPVHALAGRPAPREEECAWPLPPVLELLLPYAADATGLTPLDTPGNEGAWSSRKLPAAVPDVTLLALPVSVDCATWDQDLGGIAESKFRALRSALVVCSLRQMWGNDVQFSSVRLARRWTPKGCVVANRTTSANITNGSKGG
jgi:hypothetical protein